MGNAVFLGACLKLDTNIQEILTSAASILTSLLLICLLWVPQFYEGAALKKLE